MDVHTQHKAKGPKLIKIAVIIVSSSCFEEKKDGKVLSDKTLPIVIEVLNEFPSILINSTDFISDSEEQIKDILYKLLDDVNLHAIIFSGGTGISPKDITYETVKPLIEKAMNGFGELFRYLSFKEIGPSAMLSRALGGKIKDKAVFLLPGSPNAVKLALKELIFPELKHILYIINKKE